MKVSRYEILLKVIETGSLTRAAEYFNYTQSAVSQAMKHLEEELGVQILDRSNRKVTLTRDGEYLLQPVREIVDGERQLGARTAELQKLGTGVIRIGSYISFSCHWLPQRLSAFRQKYPNVNFEIQTGDTEQIPELLAAGSIDIAFIMNIRDRRLSFRKLFEDRMFALVPQGHRLAQRSQLDLEDLMDEQLIMPESDFQRILRAEFKKHKLEPDIAFLVKEDYTIMSMVENGLGVSVLPEFVLKRNPYNIVTIPMKKELHRELGIMTRKGDALPWAARKFIEFAAGDRKENSK
ncbi:MAG: LysR family transcriptional regulator [Anaerovoracaceae bacterium]